MILELSSRSKKLFTLSFKRNVVDPFLWLFLFFQWNLDLFMCMCCKLILFHYFAFEDFFEGFFKNVLIRALLHLLNKYMMDFTYEDDASLKRRLVLLLGVSIAPFVFGFPFNLSHLFLYISNLNLDSSSFFSKNVLRLYTLDLSLFLFILLANSCLDGPY